MNINPTSLNPNIPVTPVVTVNQIATEEVNLQAAESTKVTAPPPAGDAGSHSGGQQPGLGDNIDVYDTEKSKLAHDSEVARIEEAKKKPKPQLLGHEKGMIGEDNVPPEPEFPFLIPLGQKQPGQVFDEKI